MRTHDNEMPEGWHTVKSVLLNEICTAATFHLCTQAADALFHARLIGESCARTTRRMYEAAGNPATPPTGGANGEA